MGAMISGLDGSVTNPSPLSLPESQWDALEETNRNEYLAGFRDAMAQLREKK